MATLTWPASIVPASVTWRLRANTQSYTSPLSGATQTAELPGARWLADMTLPALDRVRWRAWSAFAARLRGQAGRVYVGPHQYRGPNSDTWAANPSALTADSTAVTADDSTVTVDEFTSATVLGTPVVHGAGQTGAALVTSGWTPQVNVMRAGDYLSYDAGAGRQMHIVVSDVVRSDDAGRATITVEAPIRTSPAAGAAVEISVPTCVMGLASDDDGAATYEPGIIARVSLALVERY